MVLEAIAVVVYIYLTLLNGLAILMVITTMHNHLMLSLILLSLTPLMLVQQHPPPMKIRIMTIFLIQQLIQGRNGDGGEVQARQEIKGFGYDIIEQ